MDPQQEAKIAELLIAQAAQLQDQAGQVGVTAFCGRPAMRGRPNERFLTNTLRNVGSANRRVEERSMWAARQLQRQLDGKDGEGRRERASARGRERSPQQHWRSGRGLGQEWGELEQRQHPGSGSKGFAAAQQRSGRQRASSRSRSRSHSQEQRGGRSPGLDQEQQQQGRCRPPMQHKGRDSSNGKRRRSSSRCDGRDAQEGPRDTAGATAYEAEASGGHSSDSVGSASGSSSSATSSSWSDGAVRPQLQPGQKVCGRGSIGSAVAVAGPYLPQLQQPGGGEAVEQPTPPRAGLGPERPRWLPGAAEGIAAGAAVEGAAQSLSRPQLVPNTQFLRGLLTAQAGSRRKGPGEAALPEGSSGSSRERSRSRGRHKSSKKKRKRSSKDKKRHRKEGKREGSSKRDKKHSKRQRRPSDSG